MHPLPFPPSVTNGMRSYWIGGSHQSLAHILMPNISLSFTGLFMSVSLSQIPHEFPISIIYAKRVTADVYINYHGTWYMHITSVLFNIQKYIQTIINCVDHCTTCLLKLFEKFQWLFSELTGIIKIAIIMYKSVPHLYFNVGVYVSQNIRRLAKIFRGNMRSE